MTNGSNDEDDPLMFVDERIQYARLPASRQDNYADMGVHPASARRMGRPWWRYLFAVLGIAAVGVVIALGIIALI